MTAQLAPVSTIWEDRYEPHPCAPWCRDPKCDPAEMCVRVIMFSDACDVWLEDIGEGTYVVFWQREQRERRLSLEEASRWGAALTTAARMGTAKPPRPAPVKSRRAALPA